MKNYMLVFGSLRKTSKRGYNFNRFGGQTYIKDITLSGFEMYNLGPYPAVCVGNGTIKCELHEVENIPFERIQRMEKGAGYDELQVILDGNISATIFTMNKSKLSNYPRLESGDWE